MVARCKGLPLAIVVLGGLLAPKKTLEEWESVHVNVKASLESKNDVGISVTDILELSYTDLPYHLKPCFLHLGNFPEDYEIPTKKLYRMWIAEGIIAATNDNDKPVNWEVTANSYLRELVKRCIVQVGNIGPAGKIKTCRLHGLMGEMCTRKAKEENFLFVVHQGSTGFDSENSSASRVGKVHRLAIHFGQTLQGTIPSQFTKASHVRSLVFFRSGSVKNNGDQNWFKAILNDFQLLRVLDIEDARIEEVPSMLGTLIHLRYLSIMGTQVRKLSSSIGNLRCLQTLDLRVCLPDNCVMRLPNVLWRMKRLMYLYLPSHPYKVKRFQKLRIKGLSNLEILKNFDTRRSRVDDLLKLENLRKLSVKNEVSKTKTLKVIIECKSIKNHKLMRLSLKIHGAILHEEPTILSGCSCLHTLEMAGTNSPMMELSLDRVRFPDKLTILSIKNVKVMIINPMQYLKELPNLRSLSLDRVLFSEDLMDSSDGGFFAACSSEAQ